MKHDSRMTTRSDLRDLEGRFEGPLATAMRAAIAQTVDPVRRSACFPGAPIRRRSAALLVALLAGIACAAKVASSSAFAGPLDQDGAETPLPPAPCCGSAPIFSERTAGSRRSRSRPTGGLPPRRAAARARASFCSTCAAAGGPRSSRRAVSRWNGLSVLRSHPTERSCSGASTAARWRSGT